MLDVHPFSTTFAYHFVLICTQHAAIKIPLRKTIKLQSAPLPLPAVLTNFSSKGEEVSSEEVIKHLVQRDAHNVRGQHEVVLPEWNLAQLLIDRGAGIVQRRALADDGERAKDAGKCEHEQEKSIQHHRNEPPIFDHLEQKGYVSVPLGQNCTFSIFLNYFFK